MSKFKYSVGSDKTTPVDQETIAAVEESTSCLISSPPPTNISIGHMYIYNFSPSSEAAASIEIPISSKSCVKFHSPAASSGPFCRICHEGDGNEDLVSPCHCTGTVGLVHLSCMEKWLGLAGSDKCEICNYIFVTIRSPKSFNEWLQSTRSEPESRRTLLSDLMCFSLLTPLAIMSSYLCIEGSKKQVLEGNSLEAGCLMALATFLITIYFVWNVLTLRFYLKTYFRWRSKNQKVKVIGVRRISVPTAPLTNGSTDAVVTIPGQHDYCPSPALNSLHQSELPINSV